MQAPRTVALIHRKKVVRRMAVVVPSWLLYDVRCCSCWMEGPCEGVGGGSWSNIGNNYQGRHNGHRSPTMHDAAVVVEEWVVAPTAYPRGHACIMLVTAAQFPRWIQTRAEPRHVEGRGTKASQCARDPDGGVVPHAFAKLPCAPHVLNRQKLFFSSLGLFALPP